MTAATMRAVPVDDLARLLDIRKRRNYLVNIARRAEADGIQVLSIQAIRRILGDKP